ncbi:hypothetical protein [Roseobacter sinensis]|uniref:Bacterial OB-fold domain-containing protein n=1 Tax=Roseobacter sinensis TaxID=2931391 RepID=A0ABT3BBZ1_9RHOB|nr:hypothetical protein [Roseobacter sp. WL0113]MCV3271106.1 hypothetical protein [Roseobacter sp. WL0113]
MRHSVWITCIALAAPSSVVAGSTIESITAETRVTVSGVVERITDEDTFILKDHTGRIPVYIGPNAMPVTSGVAVTVHGVVDDMPREIYADRIGTADGQSFELDRRYE